MIWHDYISVYGYIPVKIIELMDYFIRYPSVRCEFYGRAVEDVGPYNAR